MKKKIVLIMATRLLTLTAHAQFEAEKMYVGGSLTGLNLNYNGKDKLNLGVQAQVRLLSNTMATILHPIMCLSA